MSGKPAQYDLYLCLQLSDSTLLNRIAHLNLCDCKVIWLFFFFICNVYATLCTHN